MPHPTSPFKSPGVYIQEVEPARAPAGVSPSIMGIVGFTLRGRVDTPVVFESFEEFKREFGTLTSLSLVPLSVQAFFENGGRKGYCVRVVPPGALIANTKFDDIGASYKWLVNAISPGAWGNNVRVLIEGHPDFINEDDPTKPYYERFNFLVQEIDEEIGVHLLTENYDLVDLNAPTTAPNSLERLVNDDQLGSKTVRILRGAEALDPIDGLPTLIPTELYRVRHVDDVVAVGDGATKKFTFTIADVPIYEGSFSITDGSQTIVDNRIEQLIGDTDPSGNNTVNYESGAVDVTFSVAPGAGTPISVTFNRLAKQVAIDLLGGYDGPGGGGVISRSQVSHPSLRSSRKGMYAFERVEDIINIAIPDFSGIMLVARDQVDYADSVFNRFVLLTTPAAINTNAAIQYVYNDIRRKSKRAAVYYPWVKIFDNDVQGIRIVPPLGHIAGVYARTDLAKTVGKAPAGVDDGQLRSIFAIERQLERADMDVLYPRRINPLFSSETIGNAVWGARTLSHDFPWKYINAVRLFIFMEEVFRRDLQQFVFENNGPAVWSRAALTLTGRCIEAYEAGMLAGTTRDEAFFVRCDASNNPQNNVDAGLLTADVALAPFSPAEFILLRITRQVRPTKQKFGS